MHNHFISQIVNKTEINFLTFKVFTLINQNYKLILAESLKFWRLRQKLSKVLLKPKCQNWNKILVKYYVVNVMSVYPQS